MGIYIFSWKVLKDALIKLKDQQECDFGKHVIPYCFNNNKRIFAYEYNGYWKDVGTLSSYWEANMELIDIIPIFNLYEEFWKIYTKTDTIPPQYIAKDAYIEKSIIGDGTEVYGRVFNSVIGSGVVIEEGCVIRDSIIMNNSHIGKNTTITKSIIAEDVTIGENVELGVGEEAENVKFLRYIILDLLPSVSGLLFQTMLRLERIQLYQERQHYRIILMVSYQAEA